MDRQNSAKQQATPDSSQAWLRQYHPDLAVTYPSCDLSEMSYHTDPTDFPGSRHSSLNTEPLTLDAEQMHEAKDQAEDVLETVGAEKATEVFTKDSLGSVLGKVSMMEYFLRHGQDLQVRSVDAADQESEVDGLTNQLNTLVEKTQQVVDANELHSQSLGRASGPAATSAASEQPAQSQFPPPVEEVIYISCDLKVQPQPRNRSSDGEAGNENSAVKTSDPPSQEAR